jgi:poly(hydroxyalkanoate) depolymerase family esterase
MHPDFQRILHEATHLTRRGNLQAATRAIQEALRSSGASPEPEGDVIDVEARVLPDPDPPTDLPPAREAQRQPVDAPARAWNAEPGSREPDATTSTLAPATFNTFHHGGPGLAGRDYKLFVPAGSGNQPMPLLVMLHGCTQDPDDFAAGTRMNERAQSEGFLVLYPAQAQGANPQRCWNWFKPNHPGRGRGEPELLAGMVREVMARHPVDPDRVYVAGLSAGGAMAAILAAAYPELFAAAGVHSGLPPGAAHDVKSAFSAMKKGAPPQHRAYRVPTIVFHGDADATVHPSNGRQLADAAAAAGGTRMESEERRMAGERSATRQVHRDAAGRVAAEHWLIHGAPHAWSGGSSRGSYTDPQGPDATAEMLRFFRDHPRRDVATD